MYVNVLGMFVMFAVLDIGEGYLEGTCAGSTVSLIVYLTKPIELDAVQYAVSSPADWPAGMVTCTPAECVLSEDGKRVDITLSGYSGVTPAEICPLLSIYSVHVQK